MVDLTRPCVKCGAVDRDAQGRCRRCQKKSQATYRQSKKGCEKRNLTKPCVKCGEVDRYSNGNCKPCHKTALAKYNHSDKGRAKQREYHRKHAQTAIGRQRYYAAKVKYKKTLFEFSLQIQQKVIKQCQQNKPSGKEE